jgi:hypothetical protein
MKKRTCKVAKNWMTTVRFLTRKETILDANTSGLILDTNESPISTAGVQNRLRI